MIDSQASASAFVSTSPTDVTDGWRDVREKFKLKRFEKSFCENVLKVIDELFVFDPDKELQKCLSKQTSDSPVQFQLFKSQKRNSSSGDIFQGYGIESINFPGFIIFPNALNTETCQYYCLQSFQVYSCPPFVTNQTGHSVERSPSLTWASLGYIYNWNDRSYSESNKTYFPKDLAWLASQFANLLGAEEEFKSETAIVNFYQPGKVMGAHQDDCEKNFTRPVVSFSFGSSCIFLLGTERKEDSPLPILLREGDVVLMSGKSRLAFHGVPCVFPFRIPRVHENSNLSLSTPPFMSSFSQEMSKRQAELMGNMRLNINVRQVN